MSHFLIIEACDDHDSPEECTGDGCDGLAQRLWRFECTAAEGAPCRMFCDGCDDCAEYGYERSENDPGVCGRLHCSDEHDDAGLEPTSPCGRPITDQGGCVIAPWFDNLVGDLWAEEVLDEETPKLGRHQVKEVWNGEDYQLRYVSDDLAEQLAYAEACDG